MLIPTIGLEVHAELKTKSKLFCSCANDSNPKAPNINICPICVGYPGALPNINKQAILHLLKVGSAIGGKLAEFTEFDRKHYFYPDIPKGYQISQYEHPLVKGGELCGVPITRVHLEEDTAKSQHTGKGDYSLVDFNRSSIPLMELVTEPEITSAKQACEFAEELQLLIKRLGAGEARMELGEMRVEANISMGEQKLSGVKVEVKNLNSIKAVRGAIEYEIERQSALIQSGGAVAQETRGWDENKSLTFEQRKKETSAEYRYFPEPDLTKFRIDIKKDWNIEEISQMLPELPNEQRNRYKTQLKIKGEDIEQLIRNEKLSKLFEDTISNTKEYQLVANFLTSDCIPYILELQDTFYKNISGESLAKLVDMYKTSKVSSRGAKDILKRLAHKGGNPEEIGKRENLFQESSEEVLLQVVSEVIAQNSEAVSDYKKGNERCRQFLLGEIMKKTKGSANPKVVMQLLLSQLKNK